MSERDTQLPAQAYSGLWSKILVRYYRAPDHPAKLRVLRYLKVLSGNRRIITDTKHGFLMALDDMDLIQRIILFEGEYEPEVTELLRASFCPSDVFYDIGANIGYYSCLAAATGVETIVSVEPDPINIAVLSLNMALNGFDAQRLLVVDAALSDVSGNATFYRSHVANTGMSGLNSRHSVASFKVNVKTLDELLLELKGQFPTVLKIDVEGWELNVLRGAERLLKETPPKLIIFEAQPDLLDGTEKPLPSYFSKLGYSLQHLPRQDGTIDLVENFVARPQ